jgi:phage terminase small subunit
LSDAFRDSHHAADKLRPGSVWECASKLAKLPAIVARVRELQTIAAEATTISVRERMAWLDAIVHADPSELTRLVGYACRHCNGVNHAYQWRDGAELARAVDRYMSDLAAYDATQGKRKRPARPTMPSAEGGFGYRHDSPPSESCPKCYGKLVRVELTPHDQLSGPARALFKGVKQKADGSIEVLMHDQAAASDQLNKLQAAYTTVSLSASVSVDPNKPNPWSGASLTPEQVLERVRKSRPAQRIVAEQPAPIAEVAQSEATP